MRKHGAKFKGIFTLEVFGKNGKKISEIKSENLVTNEGLDAMLDIMLHGSTQITTWYCVLFEDDYNVVAGDTYATPGYTECIAYDEGTRPEYEEATASSQSITNAANKAFFTINSNKTIYGAAINGGGTDGNTKGDTAGGGTLFCAAQFVASQAVVSGNVLVLTYEISATDDGV